MNRRVLALMGFIPVVALIGLLAWAMVQSGGNPGGFGVNSEFGQVAVKVGPAPLFTLPLLSGESISLEDLRGKVVMVDFWSSWCPPCVAEAPALAAVYSRYAEKGVEFVGIAIWDELSAVRRHVQRFNVPYPNAVDDFGKVAVDYGVRGIPEKFFIDKEGNLVAKYIGPVTEAKLQAILDGLLAESAVG